MGSPASERHSRCCTLQVPPLDWRHYVDEQHASVIAVEQWLNTLTPWARLHEEGRIIELFDAARRGDLEDSGDAQTPITPVRVDPDLFELRHTALSKKLRFYHGEPAELPAELVQLHHHIKLDKRRQDLEIEHAVERYKAGRPTLWIDAPGA